MAVDNEYAGVVLENIAKLGNEAEKVTLISGKDGHRMRVHRIILAATSNHFAILFGTKLSGECNNQIEMAGLDGALLKDLVAYFYTGSIALNVNNFGIYMDVATKFAFTLLQKKCSAFPFMQLTTDNCIDYLQFAIKNNIPNVREKALQIIRKQFKSVPSREIWKLDFVDFKEVIECDETTAPEELIFDRLAEWTRADEFDRSKHVSDLLSCIRLKHIPTKALIDKVDAFCDTYNLNNYTKAELHDRLLNPQPFNDYRNHRIASTQVFQIYRSQNWFIRRYNPANKSWDDIVAICTDGTRPDDSILVCQKRIFVMGGRSSRGSHRSGKSFDLESRTYEDLPDMDVARRFFVPIMVNQYIYAFGGDDDDRKCERYDTILKRWQYLKSMSKPCSIYTVAAVNNFIFVGGEAKSSNKWQIKRYYPRKDSWMDVASVRFQSMLMGWKGHLYAINIGKKDPGLDDVCRYDFKKNRWYPYDIVGLTDEVGAMLADRKVAMSANSQIQLVEEDSNFFGLLESIDSKMVDLNRFTKLRHKSK